MYEQLGLNDATEQYVEWIATGDAKRAKKSNYTQNGYWSPVYWIIFEDHPKFTVNDAVILGRVLGYCQGERGQCDASTDTIAKQCHVSVRTVKYSLQALENRGFIEDITPNRRNAPHAYVDTGKLDKLMKRHKKQ